MERKLSLKQDSECLASSLYYSRLLRCRRSVIIDCEIQTLIKVFTGLQRSPQEHKEVMSLSEIKYSEIGDVRCQHLNGNMSV